MHIGFELLASKNLRLEEMVVIGRYRKMNLKYGFDFTRGFKVRMCRFACGHIDICQTPMFTSVYRLRKDKAKEVCIVCLNAECMTCQELD